MNQKIISLLIFLSVSLLTPVQAKLPKAVDSTPVPSLAPMLKQATPAVVNIATKGRVKIRQSPLAQDPFFRYFFNLPERPREKQTQSLGSGVIIDAAKGYIITNHHVIENADEIQVTLRDGRVLSAKFIGSDPQTDIAIIRVPAKDLSALPLANSDKLEVGDFVVAIGNPFGLGQTVTSGIISAIGRNGLGIEGYEDFIQTDASINPGNSGGALVNLRGQLVGINTAILAPGGGNVGIGFAIPANLANDLMRQILDHGRVRRGRLGVTTQDLTDALAQAFNLDQSSGALVSEVVPDSAANKAGIKRGDIITEANNRRVRRSADLFNFVGLVPLGSEIKLRIKRNNTSFDAVAIISAPQLDSIAGDAINPNLEGAIFEDIGPDSPIYGRVTGVRIASIKPGSAARRGGLRIDDVITGINRIPTASVKEMKSALAQDDARQGQLMMDIQRNGTDYEVFIDRD